MNIYVYICIYMNTYVHIFFHKYKHTHKHEYTILKYLWKDLEESITAVPLGRNQETVGRKETYYLLYVFLYFLNKIF